MDFNLKQWRDEQSEEEEENQQQRQQHSAKIPKLFLETQQHQQQQQETETALPLFLSSSVSDSQPNNKFTTPRFPRYCFSITQWQELELQALIYKHMVAGAQIPQQLLYIVKNSLINSPVSPYYNLNLHQFPPHFQPIAVETGYWGKGAMDPEPGRCRRTDGKKWRCSRDVVVGHKYCERHVHRGKSRSRKPVEFPPSSSAASGGGGGVGNGGVSVAMSSSAAVAVAGGSSTGGGGGRFSLSGSGASFDAFKLNQGSSELLISDRKTRLAAPQSDNGKSSSSSSNNNKLMHLFDDWPRSRTRTLEETNSGGIGNPSSSTNLSISSTDPNPTSDFLRLSTGNGNGNGESELSWNNVDGWGPNPAASMGMGGPLAEALRSSTHSSPTSVLH